jgi:hypothetical protein
MVPTPQAEASSRESNAIVAHNTRTHIQNCTLRVIRAIIQYTRTCEVKKTPQRTKDLRVALGRDHLLFGPHTFQLLWVRVARPPVIFWRHELPLSPTWNNIRPRRTVSSDYMKSGWRMIGQGRRVIQMCQMYRGPPERISAVTAVSRGFTQSYEWHCFLPC